MAHEGLGLGKRRQLTGAGVQTVEVIERGGDFAVRIHQNPPEFGDPLPPELVAEVMHAIGLTPGDLDFRCPFQYVSTGHGKLIIGVERLRRLRELTPDTARLAELSPRVGSQGYFLFTLETEDDDDAYTDGRMFAPAIGIDEDPVTGNANGPLGAYLVHYGLIVPHGGVARFRARQQAASGRGGFMDVEVQAQGRIPLSVVVEGRAVLGSRVAIALA